MSLVPYFLQLFLMLALVLGLAVGSLLLWRKLQPGLGLGGRNRVIKVVDALQIGATSKLAVVDFADRRLLVAVSRGRVELLAETEAPSFSITEPDGR